MRRVAHGSRRQTPYLPTARTYPPTVPSYSAAQRGRTYNFMQIDNCVETIVFLVFSTPTLSCNYNTNSANTSDYESTIGVNEKSWGASTMAGRERAADKQTRSGVISLHSHSHLSWGDHGDSRFYNFFYL